MSVDQARPLLPSTSFVLFSLVAVATIPKATRPCCSATAKWAGRWSPLVEVDGDDALRLDVTGVTHLFGGEDGLAKDIRARFAQAGFTARIAIALTAAAAWALSRFDRKPFIVTPAKAGVHVGANQTHWLPATWMPAFAGMTS